MGDVAAIHRSARRPTAEAPPAAAAMWVGGTDDPAEREATDVTARIIASLGAGPPALLQRHRLADRDATIIRRKVWTNKKFADETNAGALTKKSSAQRQIEAKLIAYRTAFEDDAGAVADADLNGAMAELKVIKQLADGYVAAKTPTGTKTLSSGKTRRRGGMDDFATSLQVELDALDVRQQALDAAEAKRISDEKRAKAKRRKKRRQAKEDAKHKTLAELSAMTLKGLADHLAGDADWRKHSSVKPATAVEIDSVVTFLGEAGIEPVCGGYTLGGILGLVTGGRTLAAALDALRTFSKAAGDARDPIEVAARPGATHAVLVGEALTTLLAGFPKYVLAAALNERALLQLLNGNYLDSVVNYYTTSTPQPYFQAEEGEDFLAYVAMRKRDGKDPLSYASTVLHNRIRNFHRFEAATLDQLITNFGDTSKTKPLTLVLHSAIDHNGAFHRDPNMTAVITNVHNNTLMIEGGETLADFESQITPLALSHGNNDKLDQVMFAGHGGSRTVQLGGSIQADSSGKLVEQKARIDLVNDKAAADAFFDEILQNMDKTTAAAVSKQANRRILFNACLTNSNAVRIGLTAGKAKAKKEVLDYIKANASLATYLQQRATAADTDVSSLGANASITQVDLIKPSGALDLSTTEDPKVTASKLEYVEFGTEPHGVMLALVESWANDEAATMDAVDRRIADTKDSWSERTIQAMFLVAARRKASSKSGTILKVLSSWAHAVDGLSKTSSCRVDKLFATHKQWPEADQRVMMSRMQTAATYATDAKRRAVLVQAMSPLAGDWDAELLATIGTFDAKTGRDYVDPTILESKGVVARLLGGTADHSRDVLAVIAMLGPKPPSAKRYLEGRRHVGAPEVPGLPAVPAVAAVKSGVGPRPKVPLVAREPGRAKVDAVTTKRAEVPEVPDLPELPELQVQGPRSDGSPRKAKSRKGRPKRDDVAKVPEVKPHFLDVVGIDAILAGRTTADDLLKLLP